MPHTIVLGGGLCGLAAAMMLARDGHRVTVLERDPAPVPETPEAAWEDWRRTGVAQFRQAHYMQPRGRQVLETELPDVAEALVAAGALRFDPVALMPAAVTDREPRPGDERFVTLTARRTTLEQVIGSAAEAHEGLEIRRGVAATGLEARRVKGRVHVTAVRTSSGERLAADLVVDAMGRGSTLPKLLSAAGGDPVHEEAEDSGFIYYTRFFRSADGVLPEVRGAINTPIGSFSILTLPADAGIWSVTLVAATGDQALKRLRDLARWTALVEACPRHAQWLDGEPLTGVLPMGGVPDRCRSLSGNGAGPATGVLSLADAWACTNPSLGRGMSLGLAHAALLRRVVREHGDAPAALVAAFAAETQRELDPWYRTTVAADRARLAQIDAIRAGTEPAPPADAPARLAAALPPAMRRDADIFRAGLEIVGCLTLPQEVFARPGLAEQVLEGAGDEPAPPSSPSREEVLALMR